MTFTADHHGFYREGVPFIPLIQDSAEARGNGVRLQLPARLSDDLDWSSFKGLAEEIVAKGKLIFWEIDLGLHEFVFKPDDTASFFAFSLALEAFGKVLWPLFEKQTLGVSIFRGKWSGEERFPRVFWEGAMQDDYPLFCMQNFAEYLHRLVSFLPEAALPFACIDVSEMGSAARIAQLFSKERFEYVHLALKGAKGAFCGLRWDTGEGGQGWLGKGEAAQLDVSSATVGILLPKDENFTISVGQGLDALIADLQNRRVPYRIVCEEKLTEQWDGLDELCVFSSAIHLQGKRKLQGFEAAGGVIRSF
jgi:hypothetical protein